MVTAYPQPRCPYLFFADGLSFCLFVKNHPYFILTLFSCYDIRDCCLGPFGAVSTCVSRWTGVILKLRHYYLYTLTCTLYVYTVTRFPSSTMVLCPTHLLHTLC